MHLCIRSELIEYGSPINAPWLEKLESIGAIHKLQQQLLQLSIQDEHGHWLVPPEALRAALDISFHQTQVLLDLLFCVTDDPHPAAPAMPDTPPPVDVHRLALFLCVHHYLREAARAETADAWPEHNGSMVAEPSSPLRMTARAWGRDPGDRHDQSHHAHLPMVRQQLQEHLRLQEALIQGFAPYVARHAKELVSIAAASPRIRDDAISAAEVDRLGLLLSATSEERSSNEGSPMDVCATPFSEGVRLSERLPVFAGAVADSRVPIDDVAHCIAALVRSPDGTLAAGAEADEQMLSSTPPSHPSAFDALTPPLLYSQPSDVHGIHRATVLRGELDTMKSGGMRISDCHDGVVYCLGPLQYAIITCCTDCVVVLGAVARAVRIERCERVQVIVAARHVAINTCHDCIMYLGVNRPPLLLGDNRFVQLAPHNAAYEQLPQHLSLAGIDPGINMWNTPLLLTPDHTKHHHQAMHQSSPPSASPPQELAPSVDGAPAAVTMLPPQKLHPFLVPFIGGAGPLCGGPARIEHVGGLGGVDSLTNWLALSTDSKYLFAGPFELPPAYVAAWEDKMRAAADVRQAVRTSNLQEGNKKELMAAVQSHFKEWLQQTGAMREVYDLARVEKEAKQEAEKHANDMQ